MSGTIPVNESTDDHIIECMDSSTNSLAAESENISQDSFNGSLHDTTTAKKPSKCISALVRNTNKTNISMEAQVQYEKDKISLNRNVKGRLYEVVLNSMLNQEECPSTSKDDICIFLLSRCIKAVIELTAEVEGCVCDSGRLIDQIKSKFANVVAQFKNNSQQRRPCNNLTGTSNTNNFEPHKRRISALNNNETLKKRPREDVAMVQQQQNVPRTSSLTRNEPHIIRRISSSNSIMNIGTDNNASNTNRQTSSTYIGRCTGHSLNIAKPSPNQPVMIADIEQKGRSITCYIPLVDEEYLCASSVAGILQFNPEVPLSLMGRYSKLVELNIKSTKYDFIETWRVGGSIKYKDLPKGNYYIQLFTQVSSMHPHAIRGTAWPSPKLINWGSSNRHLCSDSGITKFMIIFHKKQNFLTGDQIHFFAMICDKNAANCYVSRVCSLQLYDEEMRSIVERSR